MLSPKMALDSYGLPYDFNDFARSSFIPLVKDSGSRTLASEPKPMIQVLISLVPASFQQIASQGLVETHFDPDQLFREHAEAVSEVAL
jgi:hypothetical protein